MALTPATNKQVPEHSILDHFNKQVYLGNQFTVSSTFTVGGTEAPIFLLKNATTGNIQTLKALFQNLITVSENTAAHTVLINVYLNPTVTGAGTPATPINMRPANANTSVATVTTSPTVSGNGTLINSFSAGALLASTSNIMTILDSGQTLLVTATASAATTAIAAILGWYEL